MTGDGAVGGGVGDPEHAAASGPRSQNDRRFSEGHMEAGREEIKRPLFLEGPAERDVVGF